MPSGLTIVVFIVIILALGFDFINGFHDTANSIATTVSTRVLAPRVAILMAATLNFVGALMSEKVAKTISKGIVIGTVAQSVIAAALIAAIIWNLITWYFGIPSSSSHALIGGLVGASIAHFGTLGIISWKGVLDKVVLPLITSPLLGFFMGYMIMKGLNFILRNWTPRGVDRMASKLQILSAALMAYSHGSNDAQKSMGIITLALISAGIYGPDHGVPVWVKLLCAISMALGTSIGGWKIIKTMGVNMIKLAPINGFAAETSAAAVIETMTYFGAPVSTTHVISSTIMGVGASKRLSAVRWGVAKNIVWAWVLTLPLTATLGALVALLFKSMS